MGRPKLNKTRETVYYGIPIRIKPQTVKLVNQLDKSKKALNIKLYSLLKELNDRRKQIGLKKAAVQAMVDND